MSTPRAPGNAGGGAPPTDATTFVPFPRLASISPPLLPLPIHLQPRFTLIGAMVPLPAIIIASSRCPGGKAGLLTSPERP